jgi:CelD/BcsL family acetyltransferase involved in cellulose biosynthesis
VLERRVLGHGGDLDEVLPSWRALAATSAASAFESPDWLSAWARHYGTQLTLRLVTWWRGGDLVGVAPLSWDRRRHRGIAVREIAFWGDTGTPLRGGVDVVARAPDRDAVVADFGHWLAFEAPPWDLFHYLRVPAGSVIPARLRSAFGWRHIRLTGIVSSDEWVIRLPEPPTPWVGYLGPKARHEIRRELRVFARRHGGRVETVVDPSAAEGVVAALQDLMGNRWGDGEAYFRRDPRFAAFAIDAVRATLSSRTGVAILARDRDRVVGCLFLLDLNREVAAVLIGLSCRSEYRPLSIGKCLLYRGMEEAVARGARHFSFLDVDGYKKTFWHATARSLESGLVGRGWRGGPAVAYVTLRRVVPRALRRRLLGSWVTARRSPIAAGSSRVQAE